MAEAGYPCHFVVTVTTREARSDEVDGVDYHFVSESEFARMIRAGELLEHAEVYGQHKGIRRSDVQDALQSGKDVVIRVDVQGAETLRRLVPQAVTIFLTAESESALTERLRKRKSDSETQIEARIRTARDELARIDLFKYRVINRECALDETSEAIFAIMRAEKCLVDWQPVVL
jgi:guanylate kinase